LPTSVSEAARGIILPPPKLRPQKTEKGAIPNFSQYITKLSTYRKWVTLTLDRYYTFKMEKTCSK